MPIANVLVGVAALRWWSLATRKVVTFSPTETIECETHGLVTDDRVQLGMDADGVLPIGLSEHITYYVVGETEDTFQVSLEKDGDPVAFVGTGTAVCYVYSAPIDMGFTSDGVTISFSSETADIRVDQIEGVIRRPILTQDIRITCNLAEATMANLEVAFPSSVESSIGTLTLGGASYRSGRLNLEGKAPAEHDRFIVLREVSPVGEVGMPYKKGEVTIVPLTLSALVDDNDEFGIIIDV